ncbi:unnamed protein product [Porites lobata]|uniref:Uncharacterized protein n=1 Tax=Porites lobata TaxID=104759 RepID=A0ABN8PQE6_9CNID|nr:unnamed protein product [Porites lobata]
MPTLDECFQSESRDTYCDNFQSDLTFTTCLSSYLSFLSICCIFTEIDHPLHFLSCSLRALIDPVLNIPFPYQVCKHREDGIEIVTKQLDVKEKFLFSKISLLVYFAIFTNIIWLLLTILVLFALPPVPGFMLVTTFGVLFLLVPPVSYIRALLAIRSHNAQLGDAVTLQMSIVL